MVWESHQIYETIGYMDGEVQRGPRIVVIGGGTGSFTLLSGLKYYARDITALVNMADDGGSTGLLRDELGVLPPGDVRQCLVALSDTPKVRELFNYRFDEGSLRGHAFGNLFLTALEKMTGSFAEAVDLAGEVLHITGRVEPITLNPTTLVMHYSDGSVVNGEFTIGHADFSGKLRPDISLEPRALINPTAREALLRADIVVIAPGNLYGSIAPALVVDGVREALQSSRAKKVYICNLVTKPGQTDGFSVADYAEEIERFAGVALDYVVYNDTPPSKDLIDRYAHDGEFPVEYDKKLLRAKHYHAKGLPLVAKTIWQGNSSGDSIASVRTFIRHDADRVARELMRIYFA